MTEAGPEASGSCRCCDENAVAKLLYTYAERIDAGDFEGLADLFSDAVITFGEDGLYWHLDHVGIHERTTAAIRLLGSMKHPDLAERVKTIFGTVREGRNPLRSGWV